MATFKVGPAVNLEALATGHGLTGVWVETTYPYREEAVNPAGNERLGAVVHIPGYKSIYCDGPQDPDYTKIKYWNLFDNTVLDQREAFLKRRKLDAQQERTRFVGVSLPGDTNKSSGHIFRYLEGVLELAVNHSKDRTDVEKDLRTKVNADKSYSTVESELESDWSVTFSASDKAHLKNMYNSRLIAKWSMDLDTELATIKAGLDTFEADSGNSDVSILSYPISFTGQPFPQLEED